MQKALLLSCIAVLLNACATLEPEDCLRGDWQSIGYSDALNGKSILLNDHADACAKVHVVPNQSLYLQGYDTGARQFCTYDKGLQVGTEGRYVPDELCTRVGLIEPFQSGYQRGKRIYEKQQEIERKNSSIDDIEKKLNDIRQGKQQATPQEVDLLYREKELIRKEIDLLQREKDGLR